MLGIGDISNFNQYVKFACALINIEIDQESRSDFYSLYPPIVRIYGMTPAGQSCILNIHDFYPYFWVEIPEEIEKSEENDFLYFFEMALNDIIVRCNSSCQNIYEYEKSEYSEDLEMMNSEYELDQLIYNKNKKLKLWTDKFDIENNILDNFKVQEDFNFDRIKIKSKNRTSCSKYQQKLIFKLCIQDKYPFYGYYSKPRRMIKVQVYNYRYILQLASELSKKPIEFNGICFECFEVHIPPKLRFLTDFKINGTDYILLKNITFRSPLPKKIRSLDPPHNQWKKQVILNPIDHLRYIENHARKIITNKSFPVLFTEYSHYFNIKNKRSINWDNSVELEADASVNDILNPFIYSQLNNRGYIITPKCIPNIEDNIENWYPKLIPCLNKYWREAFNDPITQHITKLQNFQDNRKPNSNLDTRNEDDKSQLTQTIISKIGTVLNGYEVIKKSKSRKLLEFMRNRYPNYKNIHINFERQEVKDKNSDKLNCQLETDKKTLQELYGNLPPISIQTPPVEETILEYLSTEYDLSNNNKSLEEYHPNDILQYNNSFKYIIGGPIQNSNIGNNINEIVDKYNSPKLSLFYKNTENKEIVYNEELEIINVGSQETVDNACLFPTLEPAAFLDPIDFIYPKSNKLTSLESVFFFKGTFVYKIAPPTSSEVLASLGLNKSTISEYKLFERSPTKEISNEIGNINNLEEYNSEDLNEIKLRDSYDIIEPVSGYSGEYLNYAIPISQHIIDLLTMISLDVITDTPINYNRSDPLNDNIIALAYTLRSKKYKNEEIVSGLIIVDKETTIKYSDPTNSTDLTNHSLLRNLFSLKSFPNLDLTIVSTEIELINAIVRLFHYYDPHIVLALDNNMHGIGYVAGRVTKLLKKNFYNMIGRRKSNNLFNRQFNKPEKRINGRILLYIDRIIRLEYNTLDTEIYSIIKLILNNTIPNISPPVLAIWWKYTFPNCDTRYFNLGKQGSPSIPYKPFRYKVVSYIFKKLNILYEILDKLGTIPKYIELSQLYGLDFLSIQTRGSQYRVESILLKACERLNFVLFSPTKEQVMNQNALIGQPMVIEPNSSLQYSPVALLDFQSLYPSIMMAYNMCFSTILGNIHTSVSSNNQNINEITNKLGTKDNYPWFQMIDCIFKKYANIELLSYYTDNINFNQNIMKRTNTIDETNFKEFVNKLFYTTPNKSVFVRREVRQGLLPQLIDEILKTRLMLKECKSCYELYRKEIMNNCNQKANYAKNKLSNYSIHEYFSVIKSIDSTLKCLEYRQLGLKLFMNVLYGYTAASFCGRMPLSDLADSIIMTARDTVHNCIKAINHHTRWNAQIIYGDTDSVFVKLEGKSLQEAFTITNNMVDTVTSMNPFPIKLNAQGVLLPCLLISKKKYAGFIYEKIGDIWNKSTPKFICRGNEIIRRDQCQLVKSTFSKVLIDLFQNRDISSVKRILIDVRKQIFLDNIPINDYILYGGLHSNQFKKKIVNSCYLTPESKNLYRNIGHSIKKLPLVIALFSSFESVVFPEETTLGWKHLIPLPLLLLPSKYPSIKTNRTNNKDIRIFCQWHVHELLISGLEKQNNEPKFSVDFSRYYIDYILKPLNRILGLIPILFKSYILSSREQLKTTILDQWKPKGLHFVDIEDLVPSKQLRTAPALNTNQIYQVNDLYSHYKQASIKEYFYHKCSICNKFLICNSYQNRNEFSHIANRKSNTRSKYMICKSCREDREQTFALIGNNLNIIENKLHKINKICLNCSGCGFQSRACHNAWHCRIYGIKLILLRRQNYWGSLYSNNILRQS